MKTNSHRRETARRFCARFCWTLSLLWIVGGYGPDMMARLVPIAPGQSARQAIGPSDNWGLDRIDQANRPLDGIFTYSKAGAGVTIYIVDTGILTTHVDFLDGHGRSRVTYVGDFCTGQVRTTSRPFDNADGYDGHGTHVASYAAGRRSGVAKATRIVSLRVSWSGRRDDPDYAANGGPACGDETNHHANDEAVRQAVIWITRHGHRPAVLNISFGSASERTQTAIREVIRSGFVVTLSGGTGGPVSSHWGTEIPVIALVVGGTDAMDRPLGRNYGPLLALYAPAQGLMGAGKASDTDYSVPERDGCSHDCRGGDSFAAPLAAGAAALYLESHPTAPPADVKTALIMAATAGIVMNPGTTDRLLRVE
jgi:subtilisin family serine protease